MNGDKIRKTNIIIILEKRNIVPSLNEGGLNKSMKKQLEIREGSCCIMKIDGDSKTEGHAVWEKS